MTKSTTPSFSSDFYRQHLRTWYRCLAVAILIILVQGWIIHSKAKAQIQGDVELLKTAAEKYRANLEKPKTWRGELEWSQNSDNNEHKMKLLGECSINFACDYTLPAKRCAATEHKLINIIDGKEKVLLPKWKFDLQKDGSYYVLLYTSDMKDSTHIAVKQDHPFKKPGLNFDMFDPMYFFTDGEMDWDKYYLYLYKSNQNLDNSNLLEHMANYSITRDKNIVYITFIPKNNPITSDVLQIDLSKGCNVTKREAISNNPSLVINDSQKWLWEQVNDVWVPKEYIKDMFVPQPKASESHYKIRWIKNEVNTPLAKDEFSLVKLGLRQGDIISDSRTKEDQIISDKSFPPAIIKKPAE
jgi:hypothetical protein